MISFYKLICAMFFFATSIFCHSALASIVVNGTRVVYPSNEKEVSIRVNNVGAAPVLIQSWIDDGNINATPAEMKVPFVLTPPLNRIDPSKGQTLRISYLVGDGLLPNDRESLFWLNILEIPSEKSSLSYENRLKMAFRTRIKLFFRPNGLSGDANDAIDRVMWNVSGKKIKVENPTPFFVSLVNLSVRGRKIESVTLPPKSSTLIDAYGHQVGDKITGYFINDLGAVRDFEAFVR